MPALQPVPSVLRLHTKFSYGTDVDVLPGSFWSYTGSAPTSAQLTTMAGALFTSLTSPWEAMIGSQVSFTGIFLVDLTSSTSAVGEHTGAVGGTRTGSPLPASAAAHIAFTVARRYRGGKPRSELPWGTDPDLNTPQDWGTSFITAVNAAWGSLVSAMQSDAWSGSGTVSQVNVSYYGPPNKLHTSGSGRQTTVSTPRATPIVDPITAYGCATRLGTVRRRLGKGA